MGGDERLANLIGGEVVKVARIAGAASAAMSHSDADGVLRGLRDDLAALADRFTRFAEGAVPQAARRAAKDVDASIGEILIDLDSVMEWDE